MELHLHGWRFTKESPLHWQKPQLADQLVGNHSHKNRAMVMEKNP